MNWKQFFTERELKEIEFCWLYLRDYHHGTNGHNERVIIAKFAALMEANTIEIFPPLPERIK